MSAGYIDEMHEAFHSELTYRPEESPLSAYLARRRWNRHSTG